MPARRIGKPASRRPAEEPERSQRKRLATEPHEHDTAARFCSKQRIHFDVADGRTRPAARAIRVAAPMIELPNPTALLDYGANNCHCWSLSR
jgi:hypothetical protein